VQGKVGIINWGQERARKKDIMLFWLGYGNARKRTCWHEVRSYGYACNPDRVRNGHVQYCREVHVGQEPYVISFGLGRETHKVSHMNTHVAEFQSKH